MDGERHVVSPAPPPLQAALATTWTQRANIFVAVTVPATGKFGYSLHLSTFTATTANYVAKGRAPLHHSKALLPMEATGGGWGTLKTDDRMGNALTIDASTVLTELSPAMNGAGCGIEFIEHEIVGGIDSQLVVDESFEYARNATTGLSDQWAIGGAGAGFGTTHELLSQPLTPLNGLQYLGLTASAAAPVVWAQSGGLNMQGLSFEAGRDYEGC